MCAASKSFRKAADVTRSRFWLCSEALFMTLKCFLTSGSLQSVALPLTGTEYHDTSLRSEDGAGVWKSSSLCLILFIVVVGGLVDMERLLRSIFIRSF